MLLYENITNNAPSVVAFINILHGKILVCDITGKHDIQTGWSRDQFHNYISFWYYDLRMYWICIISYIISVSSYNIYHIIYQISFTLRKFMTVAGMSLAQANLHLGQQWRAFQYRCMMDCKMEANGVTPIPVAISTACWARNMWLEGAPYGPSK